MPNKNTTQITCNYCCIECGGLVSKQSALRGKGKCQKCYRKYLIINSTGKNNHFYGKKHSLETIQKMKNNRLTLNYCCKDCGDKITYNSVYYGNGVCKTCSIKYISKSLKEKYKNESHPSKGIKRPNSSGKNSPLYKDGSSLIDYFCSDCGKNIARGSKQCKSCANKLQNNPNWQGGTTLHPYTCYFTKELKAKIKKRDGFMCQHCGINEKEHEKLHGIVLSVHHIDYNKQNCQENNLITTCTICNVKANYNRDYWYAYYTYIIEALDKLTIDMLYLE